MQPQPRMKNPALAVPGILDAMQAVGKAAKEAAREADVPESTVELVNLRVSQINGCAICLDLHQRALRRMGETDARLGTVAAWRETPYFDEAERAALALAEAGTRIADRSDPVPDEVFERAAKHYDEQALAALIVVIATINSYNRLNIIAGQVTGEWTASIQA
jgi:AhpD family alkylhydroperoxidase